MRTPSHNLSLGDQNPANWIPNALPDFPDSTSVLDCGTDAVPSGATLNCTYTALYGALPVFYRVWDLSVVSLEYSRGSVSDVVPFDPPFTTYFIYTKNCSFSLQLHTSVEGSGTGILRFYGQNGINLGSLEISVYVFADDTSVLDCGAVTLVATGTSVSCFVYPRFEQEGLSIHSSVFVPSVSAVAVDGSALSGSSAGNATLPADTSNALRIVITAGHVSGTMTVAVAPCLDSVSLSVTTDPDAITFAHDGAEPFWIRMGTDVTLRATVAATLRSATVYPNVAGLRLAVSGSLVLATLSDVDQTAPALPSVTVTLATSPDLCMTCTGPGAFTIWNAAGQLLYSLPVHVYTTPGAAVLSCPNTPIPAQAFNCTATFYDVLDGTELYANLDDVAATAAGGSASIVPPSNGPVQSRITITVHPTTDPPPGFNGNVAVQAVLKNGQLLGTALVPIIYVADNSSSVACAKPQVALAGTIECTLTPRRLGELVWTDAATIGFEGDGALASVAGTLSPTSGPAQSVSFRVIGQSGRLLTGPSLAMALSYGVSIANATIIVFASPDATSSAMCPGRVWAGESAVCTFYARKNSLVIWANLADISSTGVASVKGASLMSGYAVEGQFDIYTTSNPSSDHSGPGRVDLSSSSNIFLGSGSITVLDVPSYDGSSLACPATPMVALVPFNCTYYPKRVGFSIYGVPENVSLNATNARAAIAEAAGTFGPSFIVAVVADRDPVVGGESSVEIFAWLSGTEERLGEAKALVSYVVDASSSLECGAEQLALASTVDCTLTPRRLGELVWAEASTIGFTGDGALAPVAGSLQPSSGPAQKFFFRLLGQSGRVLTGNSTAMTLSNGESASNTTVLVYGPPDSTSTITCDNPAAMWAGSISDCIFIPRMQSAVIWSYLNDVTFSVSGSIKGFVRTAMEGYQTEGKFTVVTTNIPDATYTGPGAVAAIDFATSVTLASYSFVVIDNPDSALATSVLDCPLGHQTALVSFNCTFYPKTGDVAVFGIASSVTAYSVNSSTFVADPPSTVATQFTVTVTAAASPISEGGSSIVIVAYLLSLNGSSTGMALARSTVPIVYIADESSSLACGVAQLILMAVVDCTLTPRRLGELVWADAATIGFIGDGALSPVAGSLQPGAGPAQSFVFQMRAERGRLLTGPSVAMALSAGLSVANASVLVYGAPDNTTTATCDQNIWAGVSAVCSFTPRLDSEVIWALLDELVPVPFASVKASTFMTGYATEGNITFDTTAVPMSDHTGPGGVEFWSSSGQLLTAGHTIVQDVPEDMNDGCSLVCPSTQQTALVPFNCTFVPRRAGFVIYGLSDNVTANATNADAVVFEPFGTLATQFTITVTAWATPVTNGSSAIRVLAWLPGMETQLVEAGSAIVYIADESSSLACGAEQLILTAAVDCTLTPRRLGELVWADAATIGFIGDGALSPVAGSLQPGAGPAQSFVFRMLGESGRLLTGPSKPIVLSSGAPVANASVLVYGPPDNSSSLTCPGRVWAGQIFECLFTPRMNDSVIWARLDDTAAVFHNLVLGAGFSASLTDYIPMLGYATSGRLFVNTTAEPSEVFTGPGRVQVVLQADPVIDLASASISVMDIPRSSADNSTLSCPSYQLPALIPFNCTFIPRRAGFVIYGLSDNVTANATNADAVVFEPFGTLATQFTITVTAWATPVTNGSSAIRMLAWLPGMETQLAEAGSAIVYIADESSSLACGVAQLILTAVVDCTLTPRRLGELVWADAATIGFIGDGALSPVAGSLQPGAGPAQSFVFQMLGESGRLLTGPSMAMALSSNASIVNSSITVYRDPDATSSLICPSEPVWASNRTTCTLIPRWASQRITVLMEDLFVSWGGSVLQVDAPSGVSPEPVLTVSSYAFPTSGYTGPGEVTVAFRSNASDVVASASITVIDVPRDSSSSLVCSAFSLVGGQSINCTFSPAQTGIPLMASLANMSVVVRGMPGSAAWMPDSPAIGDLFLISHVAPMITTGGYMLAVYSTGFNGTVFEDAASAELYVTNSVIGEAYPDVGPMTGGTRVTLTGTALPPNTGAKLEARVCNSPAVVWSLTATQAVIVTPPAFSSEAVNETGTSANATSAAGQPSNSTASSSNSSTLAPVGLAYCDIDLSVGGVLAGIWPSSFRYNAPPVAHISPLPARIALPIASLELSAFLSFDPDIVAQRGAPAPSEGLFFAWSVVGPGPAHFGNDSLANVTVANLTAPGNYTFTVDVTDADGGELASASVTVEIILLPVLVTTVRADMSFDAFQLKYANASYKAALRSSLAKAYGVVEGRIAGISAKAGSVILSVNVTASSLAEAEMLPQVAQAFTVQPVADLLQVPAAGVAQINSSILDRGENAPPMPILVGPKDIEVNGSAFWTVLDGRQSSDVDGAVQSYVWNLIPDPGCPLTQADLDTSVPGFCNVTTKEQGFCQIEFNVEDSDLTTSTEPIIINLVMNPRQNLPPVIFGTRKVKARIGARLASTSLKLEPRIADQDEDGFIASVRWEQVFGPGNATLKSSGQTAVEISGLTAGKWRFRVTATDNGVMGVLRPLSSKADFDVEVSSTSVVDSVDPATAKAAGETIATAVAASVAASVAIAVAGSVMGAVPPALPARLARLGPLAVQRGDAPNPKVEGDTNTGTTTLINQTQKIAVIGGIAGENVPESYRAMSGALGTFMLQFNVVPLDGSGNGTSAAPTPTPVPRPAARKMLQAVATAATMSASEMARKAFQSAMLYGFGILAIVSLFHLLLHLVVVRWLKKLPGLPGKLAFPFPELSVLMSVYQPMAMASAAYLPLAPAGVQAGIIIFLILGCVVVPALFLCVLVYRIRNDRLLIYEPNEPIFQTFTGSRAPDVVWEELREAQRGRIAIGRYRRPGERVYGFEDATDVGKPKGHGGSDATSERSGGLLEELDESGFEADGRARPRTVAGRMGARVRRAVTRFAIRFGDAMEVFFEKLDAVMFRGNWVVNQHEYGNRAKAFADGWNILYGDFTDKQMAFLTGVLALVRQLLSVIIVGVMSAQQAQSSGSGGEDNVVSGALASVGESFTPMLQVTLLLGINVFTLVLHIIARPFICRWVGIVEGFTLFEESIIMLAILQVDLGWGWDAGVIMFQVAMVMSFILVADNMLGKLQLLGALIQKRMVVVNAIQKASSAVSDAVTGRVRALRVNCAESRIALELLASKTRNAWTIIADVEWTLRPDASSLGQKGSSKAKDGDGSKPTSTSVDMESLYRSRYDSILLGLFCALQRTPAAVDGTTKLHISVAEENEEGLHGALEKALSALRELRQQKRREDAEAAARMSVMQRIRQLFGKKKAEGARQAETVGPKPRPLNLPALAHGEDEDKAGKGCESGEAEAKLPAALKRLKNDVALNELLGKHGLFSEEERAAELERRSRELERLAERGRLQGDRGRTCRLKSQWEAADKARVRQMRYWRGVVRELWRFGDVEVLPPAAAARDGAGHRSPAEAHRVHGALHRARSMSAPGLTAWTLPDSAEPNIVLLDESSLGSQSGSAQSGANPSRRNSLPPVVAAYPPDLHLPSTASDLVAPRSHLSPRDQPLKNAAARPASALALGSGALQLPARTLPDFATRKPAPLRPPPGIVAAVSDARTPPLLAATSSGSMDGGEASGAQPAVLESARSFDPASAPGPPPRSVPGHASGDGHPLALPPASSIDIVSSPSDFY
eukprot:tig00000882_g5254.t1